MDFKKEVAKAIAKTINKPEQVIDHMLQIPKESSHGDIAFPCFGLAKELKRKPVQIAENIAKELQIDFGKATALGPYVNIIIQNNKFIAPLLKHITEAEKLIESKENNTITIIESPSPNTNKPLHVGHLRNMLLGSTLTNLKNALGKKTHLVNLVNDRGVHICKSMLAYQKWGNNQTPQEAGKKSDHFVGDWYVKFNQEAKNNPSLEQEAQEMLIKWEQGDKDVIALWKKMNNWTYEGFKQTYDSVNFHSEKDYFESDIYKNGRDIILKGVEDGAFYKDETGAIIADLTDKKLDKKVLLRKDGTAVYITQDIFLAKQRFHDYKFNELIYVVGNEQDYHFKVLFEIFKKLNFPFANNCKHFSYGMIDLPTGKMKSREGNIIDTDELIAETIILAKEAVKERFADLDEKEVNSRAHIITQGAIRFFFLKFDPVKNFVFNPKASLSFEGETGPYVQYTHTRIASILRKSDTQPSKKEFATLQEPEEKEIAKLINSFPIIVEEAAEKLKPNLLCNYLLSLCQSFNSYYSKYKIIQDDKKIEADRLALILAVNKVIKEGLNLLGIQAPERM
ncbi:arginine--tRNA ligase [Candidatus Woesearchaeota archaeon]|nr:arginine--tRNA ligase [Candidatus Woesearchaeota archaeon]